MKLIGMALIVASTVVFSHQKALSEERRLSILEELLRFIERIRIEIGCYLKTISEIASDFQSELLCELGFFEALKSEGVYNAYLKIEPMISMSEDTKKLLQRFFYLLGNGYADEQLKLIDNTSARLSEIIKTESQNLPKRKKLIITLSCAAALSLIILLI